MVRTVEEQKQYDALSPKGKSDYNKKVADKPHWTHRQVYVAVVMNLKTEDVIEGKNIDDVVDKNGNPKPSIQKEIFDGVKTFLVGVGIVGGAIIRALDEAIDILADLIANGIEWIGDKLNDFWKWLNS